MYARRPPRHRRRCCPRPRPCRGGSCNIVHITDARRPPRHHRRCNRRRCCPHPHPRPCRGA
uniref:Uncharacterized protein n=1 Tax=Oryza rufipogon TaxID=4529 RepID=A0A0E0NI55_ORYRU